VRGENIMRKISIILLVVLMLVSLLSSVVMAEEYDMWKGEFVRGNNEGNTFPNAGGKVILNYVKGQQSFTANVEVYGLIPYKRYYALLLTGGNFTVADKYMIGEIVTDEFGNGHLLQKGISPDSFDLTDINRRVVVYANPTQSYGWVLSTSDTVADGDFQPVDSNRGE
jgi:hypothetical protein